MSEPHPSTQSRKDADEIAAVVSDVVVREGGALVGLQVGGSARNPLVRAYVDLPGGTTVDACAILSRRIEARLESAAMLGERYTLEVSSPGLDRPLRSRRDFERLLGRPVEVRVARAGAGLREIVGLLEEVEEEPADVGLLEGVEGKPPDAAGDRPPVGRDLARTEKDPAAPGKPAERFSIAVQVQGPVRTLRFRSDEILRARAYLGRWKRTAERKPGKPKGNPSKRESHRSGG